jgi:hypothetical protein
MFYATVRFLAFLAIAQVAAGAHPTASLSQRLHELNTKLDHTKGSSHAKASQPRHNSKHHTAQRGKYLKAQKGEKHSQSKQLRHLASLMASTPKKVTKGAVALLSSASNPCHAIGPLHDTQNMMACIKNTMCDVDFARIGGPAVNTCELVSVIEANAKAASLKGNKLLEDIGSQYGNADDEYSKGYGTYEAADNLETLRTKCSTCESAENSAIEAWEDAAKKHETATEKADVVTTKTDAYNELDKQAEEKTAEFNLDVTEVLKLNAEVKSQVEALDAAQSLDALPAAVSKAEETKEAIEALEIVMKELESITENLGKAQTALNTAQEEYNIADGAAQEADQLSDTSVQARDAECQFTKAFRKKKGSKKN